MNCIQFIGTQRSGSNLLRVMLNQLPEISAPHPPHVLKTFFPLLPLYGDLNVPANFHQLTVDVCDWVNGNPVPWTGVSLNPDNIYSKCTKHNLIELFSAIHKEKAKADDASIWCCKSMESIYYVHEIESMKLNPFYIYLYRDGRDVALSFKKAFVGPKHVYFIAKKWKEEQELSLTFLNSLDESRYMLIKYEDFIHTPRAILSALCDKLQIPTSEKMFEYYASTESINTASSGDMWANLSKPILPDNFNKYKRELTTEEIKIFELVAGSSLNSLGYETEYWPFSNVVEFTSEETEQFEFQNQQMTKSVQAAKGLEEIEKRRPQEELLRRIKERKPSAEKTQ